LRLYPTIVEGARAAVIKDCTAGLETEVPAGYEAVVNQKHADRKDMGLWYTTDGIQMGNE
jgi:hypothetical protein